MKLRNCYKESKELRKARIELSGTTVTKVVPDKRKYTRKAKHKLKELCV